jgi:hypothetical protein
METLKSQFSAVPPSNEQMQKLLRLLHEVLLSSKKSDEASSVRRDTCFEIFAFFCKLWGKFLCAICGQNLM